MNTVCEKNKCAGCMACIDICEKKAIRIIDNVYSYNAVIDDAVCVKCGKCKTVCQVNNPVQLLSPTEWYQGWAEDNVIRLNSSSGGIATSMAKNFLLQKGVVCSCSFANGLFGYEIIDVVDKINVFQGSKYVKSNPSGIYKQIIKLLRNNTKVLFIGLPCHVAGLKNILKSEEVKNLYTADLICHGTPSPKVLEYYLKQKNINIFELKDIAFRNNGCFRLSVKESNESVYSEITPGEQDKYLMSFLNMTCYTENCYSCRYAQLARCSDITIGDSWGSDLKKEMKKGVSLILCQTEKGRELLESSKLVLNDVDIEKAIAHNHQLKNPSRIPSNRNKLIEGICAGQNLDFLMWRYFPKKCLKQKIKKYLIKFHIIDNEKSYYKMNQKGGEAHK